MSHTLLLADDSVTIQRLIELTFADGVPVALNGNCQDDPVQLVRTLNEIGGRHGVGRIDVVEDRVVGIKSREIYELPSGTIITAAHKALESLTLSREVLAMQRELAKRYGELVYDGLWFSHLREALDAFFTATQARVNGRARVKLYKGQATVIVECRRHPDALGLDGHVEVPERRFGAAGA